MGVDNVDNDPQVIHNVIPHGDASFDGYPQIHNAY
jgi:hypothetical protein